MGHPPRPPPARQGVRERLPHGAQDEADRPTDRSVTRRGRTADLVQPAGKATARHPARIGGPAQNIGIEGGEGIPQHPQDHVPHQRGVRETVGSHMAWQVVREVLARRHGDERRRRRDRLRGQDAVGHQLPAVGERALQRVDHAADPLPVLEPGTRHMQQDHGRRGRQPPPVGEGRSHLPPVLVAEPARLPVIGEPLEPFGLAARGRIGRGRHHHDLSSGPEPQTELPVRARQESGVSAGAPARGLPAPTRSTRHPWDPSPRPGAVLCAVAGWGIQR